MAVGRDVPIAPLGLCAWVMCGRYGGAIMTSRQVRSPAAHRAADRAAACKTLSVCYLPSRAPRWRAPTGDAARRRDGWPPGLPARALPQRDTTTGHGRTAPPRAIRRPTLRVLPGASPCAPYSRAGRGVRSPPPAARPRHLTATGTRRPRAPRRRDGDIARAL